MQIDPVDGGFVLHESIQGKTISQTLKAGTRPAAEVEANEILERWRERLRNLWLRGGRWYCVATVDGRRISKGLDLPESDWEPAGRRARALIDKASKGKWEVLAATSSKPGFATFGDLETVFRGEAVKHGLRDRTVNDYISSMRTVLGVDGELSTTPVTVATRAAVQSFVSRRLKGNQDENTNISIRRSCKSVVRQARALFGKKWAMEAYRAEGLCLPDMAPFCTCFVTEADPSRYVMTEERKRLLELTHRQARSLPRESPPIWAAYLLCYWLAMRASEAAAARWTWIVQDDAGRWWMQIINRPEEGYRTKATQGKVPVPIKVKEWLDKVAESRPGDVHIIPAKHHTGRGRVIERELAGWMRGLGWDRLRYQHCAHELRAARGSEWYTKRGLEAACTWLRHQDPNTTKRFYADFTSQPPTLEVGE